MSESKEPEPKKKPRPGEMGAPLPRLWKVEPEEDSSETEVSKKAAKPKKPSSSEPFFESKKSRDAKKAKDAKKKAKSVKDGAGKTVLVEETPEVDTYEYRQRVRLIVGSVAAVLVLLFGIVTVMKFAPSTKVEEPQPEDLLAAVTQKTAARSQQLDETEATSMLDRARVVAKNGKVELAVSFLNTVTNKYPATKAAKEAKAALERPTRNLPLFPDGPTVVADLGKPERKSSGTPAAQGAATDPPRPGEGASDSARTAPVVPPVIAKTSRGLPAGFHPRPGTEVDESGWAFEIVGEHDESTLVLIPGGIFIQGRNDTDPTEAPAHEVKLSTYYIDKNEVTNRQFDLFQKETGSRSSERSRALSKEVASSKAENKTAEEGDPLIKDEYPAVMVTAREAKDYADWAGKNLPTEAQWEIAGRTSDGRVHPWGQDPPSWNKPRETRQIDEVMSYPQDVSAYGAYDLAGNAWEWTKDWFDSRYYHQFKNSTAENPTGPPSSRVKQLVVKGGDKDWGLTRREGYKVETRLRYLGFRCVLQVEGPGNAFQPKPAPPPANGQPKGKSQPALGPVDGLGNGAGADGSVPF